MFMEKWLYDAEQLLSPSDLFLSLLFIPIRSATSKVLASSFSADSFGLDLKSQFHLVHFLLGFWGGSLRENVLGINFLACM